VTASLSILHRGYAREIDDGERVEPVGEIQNKRWDPQQFGEEQIRGLVRRVFSPGWPRPSSQVVFSAADDDIDIASVCRRTGGMLATEGVGRVCLVEANLQSRALELSFGRASQVGNNCAEAADAVRKSSRQVGDNVWLVPAATFVNTSDNLHSAFWLRSRLGELRREFEYSLIHAGPATHPEAIALLAHLCDGLILTLEAHQTRRLAALKVREQMLAANVRLLGVVLHNRTFPIPQGLYRRL
jgi:hypothetical protein